MENCDHDWFYGGVGANIGNLYNKCRKCKCEVNLPEDYALSIFRNYPPREDFILSGLPLNAEFKEEAGEIPNSPFKKLLLTDKARKNFKESCKGQEYEERRFWFPEDYHEESGPFPDFSKYISGIDAYNKDAGKSIVVFGSPQPREIALIDPQPSETLKEIMEARDRAVERIYNVVGLRPEVKCQRSGCGKVLSPPTNHRCDICYSYYQ